MTERRIIRAFGRFYRAADKNCGKAFAALVRQVGGENGGSRDADELLRLFESALEQAEKRGYVYFGGCLYKGNFTFRSVTAAAEVLESRLFGEKKRVSAALAALLSPFSAVRAGFLSEEGKRSLLYRVLGALEGEKERGREFAQLYGGFVRHYGTDPCKGRLSWREFCVLSAAIGEKAAKPFEQGAEELFRRLTS